MLKRFFILIGVFSLSLLACCHAQNNTEKVEESKATDWAQFYRYRDANRQIAGQSINAVFMGNSITDFWIKNDSAFFADNGYVDRGISGQTSSEMLVRFRRDVIDLHPRVVVILAGTNDIAGNNGKIELSNVLGNIQSMCELAKANGIEPVLCSVLPSNYFFWIKEFKPAQAIRELNAMIREYAEKEELAYVDYYTPMATPDGEIKKELSNDGCHPNARGYEVMKAVVKGVIDTALQR